MWMLIPLLLVPLVIMGFMWASNRGTFTFKEFALLEGVMIVLLLVGFQAARYGAISDTEIWNGRITAKKKGVQKCCHCHQQCISRNKEGKCTSSREVCTHSVDHWWTLEVSTGDRITDDCSGSGWAPKWWTNASIGESAAIPHRYTNYLLADPDSVLIQSAVAAPAVKVPGYPEVYDRYKITRFFAGGTSASVPDWDAALDNINADLGKPQQVNIIVIATTDPSPTFADAIERDWLYGKKNDVIFVLGAPDGDNIEWAKVVSISNVEMLKLTARDEMPGMRLSEVGNTSAYIRNLVSTQFTRTSLAEYEYLWASVQPSLFGTIILYVIAIAGSIAGSLAMVHTDMFGDDTYRRRMRF